MLTARSTPRCHRGDDEDGFALVTTILLGFILSILIVSTLNYALQAQPQARRDQDYHAAIQAAEAGVDDYIFHLNQNPNYWYTPDPANQALVGWKAVPGAPNPAEFRYTADTSSTDGTGTIVLTVSGRVGGVTRTIQTQLRQDSFTDYVYFSDLEVNDPTNAQKYPGRDPVEVYNTCNVHRWEGRDDNRCNTVSWTKGDVAAGNLHTNDTIRLSGNPGPKFLAHVTDSCPQPCVRDPKRYVDGNPVDPYFQYPNEPGFKATLPLPPSNAALAEEAKNARPGCLFTGPTRIVLKATGRFDVWSPNSKQVHCVATASSAGVWKDVVIPPNGVVYVQNIPSSGPNANASPISSRPFIPGAAKPNKAPAKLPNGQTYPNGFPLAGDITPYDNRAGDVFVEGTINGRLTIGAENNVIITSDILQSDTEKDMLGLLPNNFIWNYHPVSQDAIGEQYELCAEACMENVQIQAAMLSLTHAYGTQNPDSGASQGTILTYGSIAQKWRNNVGGGSFCGQVRNTCHRGYAKEYRYDPKLRYLQPPHFLAPEASAWKVAGYAELPNGT